MCFIHFHSVENNRLQCDILSIKLGYEITAKQARFASVEVRERSKASTVIEFPLWSHWRIISPTVCTCLRVSA